MAKQVVKLGLEFDTKSAISSYRQLISEMQKGGADPKAIRQFTAAVEKAETELAQLAAEGSTGFTDSKSMEQYQKKVLKVTTAMQQLALRMQDFSKDKDNFPLSEAGKLEQKIKDLKKAVTDLANEAKKNLQASLRNMGFSKTQAAEIANSVKNEEELKQRLEEERRIRQQNLDLAKEQAQAQVDSARATKARTVQSNSSRVKDLTTGVEGISGVDPNQIRETVAQAFRTGISKGVDNVGSVIDDLKRTFAEKFGEGTEITNALSEMLDKGVADSGEGITSWLKNLAMSTGEALNPDKFKDQVAALNQVSEAQSNIVASQFSAKMGESAQAARDAATEEGNLANATANTERDMRAAEGAAGGLAGTMQQSAQAFLNQSEAEKESLRSTEQLEGGFGRLADRLKYMFGFTAMFNKLRQILRSTFNDIQNLDKAYASIAYVTNETVADLWQTYGEYAGMAEKLGQSTEDVIKASAIYRQQGLGTKEALELTTDTMKLATIAGNDYSTATQEMTAALRGFKMEMDEGSHVSDVYSELAAHAAASVDDIAQAMSRTASIANSAGMSFENTSAFLTQMIETTQESAENIGTSMKTIIARFTELKENVAGTAESEFDDLDFNNVDKALKSVGVALKDTQGQFRNLDDVFLELSSKWENLDRNTQRYIATVAAGSRQQSRFIALMDNYDRTVELIDTAADSEGKANEQFSKAADTIEFKLNAIKTKWEEFKLSIMDSNFVGGILDTVNKVMDSLKNVKMPQVAIVAPFAIAAAKNFVLNFINGIKKSTSNLKQVGNIFKNSLAKQFSKGKDVIQLKADAEDIKKKMAESGEAYQQAKARIENNKITPRMANGDIRTGADLVRQYQSEIQQTESRTLSFNEATLELAQSLGYEGDSAGEAATYIKNLKSSYDQDTQAVQENIQAHEQQRQQLGQNQKAQLKAQVASDLFRQSISAVTMSLSGLISGTMSASQAFFSFITAIGGVVLNLGIQALTTQLATQAEAVMSLTNKGLIASFMELGFAEMWATAPLLVIVAIAAGAILVFGGLALAIGAIVSHFHKVSDQKAISASKSNQLAQKEEDLNKQLETQKERLSNVTEELKEQQKTYDLLSDSLSNYLDKNGNEKFLASEDADEWLSTQQEIADIMPDLIDHYDAEGNAILKTGQAFKDAYETQKKAVQELKKEEADASFDVAMTNFELSATKTAKNGLYNNLINNDNYLKALTNLSAQTAGRSEFVNVAGDDWAVDNLTIDSNGKLHGESHSSMTAVGLLEGARNNQDVDLGNYIKDALTAAGKDKTFGIEEKDTALEVLDKLADKLTEGDTAQERETFSILQEVLQENPNLIEQEKRTLIREQKKNEQQLNIAVNNLVGANASLVDGYEDASKNVQHVMQAYAQNSLGLDIDKLKEDFNKNWTGKIDENGNPLEEYTESYYEQFSEYISTHAKDAVDENSVKTALQGFSKDQIAALETFYEEHSDAAASDLIEAMQNDLTLSPEVKEAWRVANQDLIDGMVDNAQRIADALGLQLETDEWGNAKFIDDEAFTKFYAGLGQIGQQALASLLDQIRAESGEEAANQAAFNYRQSTSGLSKQSQNDLLATDWSSYSNLTSKTMESQMVSQIATRDNISKEEAQAAWDAAIALAKQNGQVMAETTVTSLAAFGRQSDDIEDAFEKNASSISKYLQNTKGQMSLTVSEGKELKATFDKLASSDAAITGLDEALGDFDETTGKMILDTDLLREKIEEYTTARLEALEKEKQIAEENGNSTLAASIGEEIEELQASIGYINELVGVTSSLSTQIDNLSENISKASSAISQYQKDGYVNAESLASIGKIVGENNIWKYVTDDLRLNTDALLDYIDTEITHLEVLAETDKSQTIEIYKLKALRKEMQNTRKETEDTTKDLQEKYQKALESLADAQQDVVDKQKSLNEAIEEYHKLLNGSDNRQSGLDLLYNYKQAISAFSDEMTRAQDLLDNSASVDDAVAALSRYTNAAHQELAYMQALSQRYNAGLEERRKQLLSGATSYTNELTGNTTTINFNDYVKYNADTGMMAIDQKLLQDAKIADEWKDYIEKQVDDYNKLYQDALKNEDDFLKKQREIQKRREDAIKKYADFEKDIAETLKAQYQEQVDNLKNKYDSMKEADDDYLNALQEAIEKQRKLREKENKWEDLAQKEKKLSLMQRDTSGANTIETQKLQKEIEKDRETLLDESIDSAIENMQKLAEKQDELRQTEVELKEALLENTAYWNEQAESLAASFETADEFAAWFAQTSTEVVGVTATQFENTMIEARNKFNGASEKIAWDIQDSMSQTGDAVQETVTITGEEVEAIVKNTSDTFVEEVKNTFERTKTSFNENMDSAIEKVHSAETALQEAINKLTEASAAAQAAAEEIRKLQELSDTPKMTGDGHTAAERDARMNDLKEALLADRDSNGNAWTRDSFINAYNNYADDAAQIWDLYGEDRNRDDRIRVRNTLLSEGFSVGEDGKKLIVDVQLSGDSSGQRQSRLKKFGFTSEGNVGTSNNVILRYSKQYKEGGLVNYTGPAWVDGTPERPEAFLSSEDTERIGNAAKLLADIPALGRSDISTTNTSYGDTNIEINLNIESISSDTDIDYMLDRMKQEIVDIARPVGTNVILQQQI